MILRRQDLMTLEAYASERPLFRRRVIEHKHCRHLALGEHVRLLFEDALTIQYQVQEMLRIERIFEPAAIQEELDAYNPLIPDGDNWKATMLIEYEDAVERKQQLARLMGIEDKVWMQVADNSKVYAIADEDLERENGEKTSSVHFLRFQLTPAMINDALSGLPIHAGIDHAAYPIESVVLNEPQRQSLAADLVASERLQ